MHDGICLFVRWENTYSREGRPIQLDEKQRVKYNIPFLVPKQKYVGSRILITNCGAIMRKAPAEFRVPMPRWCVVFQEWHEAALLKGPTTKGSCMLCAELATRGHVGEPSKGLLFICIACVQVWHECCAKRCSTNVGVIDWASFVCPACSNHLRA